MAKLSVSPWRVPMAPVVVPRRAALKLLGGAVAVATLPELAGCSHAPAPTIAAATPAFMAVSSRLTGYGDLDAMLGGRMTAILRHQSPAFDSQLEALHHALPANGQPLTLDALPAGLKATATTILRGWQTGVVGEGAQAQVVSYEDTLMYRPIADVCVLPTYARGEPHYWAQPLPTRVSA